MSPALNGSSAIRRFKCSNAIEIRDGITFDFYTGLPHVANTEYMHTQNIPFVVSGVASQHNCLCEEAEE